MGRYVEVLAAAQAYALTPRRVLSVLDHQAFGGEIHEGYGVRFTACGASYALQGFGLSAEALYRMAESFSLSR
jgi:hypothetical protein